MSISGMFVQTEADTSILVEPQNYTGVPLPLVENAPFSSMLSEGICVLAVN
jgi:hypothetical protein